MCTPGGRSKEDGARFFSVKSTDRTRSKGHKMKYRKFHLNTRKITFTVRLVEHWHRLPGEAVEAPSLELFKTQLDTVLSNLLQLTLL